ncbi:MAG: hypothetical protein A4E66_02399 [Syntrophus sp. PtaB.Bin001]|nr:MAG: hypothetical protein A4E66_02399 [Syntrophus sp. PtaB.Bin001]
MKKTAIVLFLGLCLVFGALGNAFATLVTATVTADNHYAIYYGTDTNLTYVGTNESGSAGSSGTYNWSAAETWPTFDVPVGQYIYVVGWSDNSVAQGWKGQFVTSYGTLYSDSSWEYLLSSTTINDLGDGSQPPTAEQVKSTISSANPSWRTGVNTDAYSGWGTVDGLESSPAQWIWGTTMYPGSGEGEYQVFRHSAPTPIPAAAWLLGSGLLGLVGIRRRIKS